MLPKILSGSKTIAMQYSPENNIPYIGLVDAGTIELIRKSKKKIVSSADLVQQFEATWNAEQLSSHLEAGKIVDRITREAFHRAAKFVREGKPLSEFELQQWILEQFRANGLTSLDAPIVAVQPNNGNPHYEPRARPRGRFAPAICCCSTSGRNSTAREPSITTSPGSAISAHACPTPTPRFSASPRMRATPRSNS